MTHGDWMRSRDDKELTNAIILLVSGAIEKLTGIILSDEELKIMQEAEEAYLSSNLEDRK
jgi:hypothetical protein